MRTAFLLLMLNVLLLSPLQTNAQDLTHYRWEKRQVLLLTDNPTNSTYQQQLEVLRAASADLEELQIVVWQIQPQRVASGAESKPANWSSNDTLYPKYKSGTRPFEFVLLGLDGGVKLRQQGLVSIEELYTLINTMPMRRAELRRRGGE